MATENEPTIQSLAEGQERLASLLTDFIEEQRRVNEEQRRVNEEQRQFNEEQRQFNEEQRQFNEEQRQFNEEQRQFNEHTDVRLLAIQNDIEEQRRFNEEQLRFNERTDRRLRTIQDDIAEVKGGHARTETIRRADIIASAMNLIYERTLSAGELDDMVRENPGIDVARNELQSFAKADLVIKAKDGSRLTNYIAVEISYTADQRDTDRAVRNADLLTRFTGRPAYAVIASVKNDDTVSSLIRVGSVHWYEIPLRTLQAE